MAASINEQPLRSWDLRINTEDRAGVAILTVAGRISHRTSSILGRALQAASPGRRAVVLDLHGVDYISSAGMSFLAETGSPGTPRLLVCGLTDPVRIALELASLPPSVAVEPSLADALARIAEENAG